jgi:hypothetical protein
MAMVPPSTQTTSALCHHFTVSQTLTTARPGTRDT